MSNQKKATPTVGSVLKKARLEQKLTLHDVEVATKIRGKYLRSIESDDPSLPRDVYIRGFVQSYANHLGLDGRVLSRTFAESGVAVRKQTSSNPSLQPVTTRRLVWSTQMLAAIGVIVAFLGIVVYLVGQFSALAAPPRLDVSEPAKDQDFYGGLLDIKGHSTPGADIFVNDSPILIDGSGNFTDQLALQNGVNTIRITAKNHLGKSTTVTRNILAHIPSPDVTSAIPTTPFDGVGVAVSAQAQSVFVTVAVDGQTVFKGTMLPGTTRTFKGKNLVHIDTSNGSSTLLTVTNSLVAGKVLGAVGSTSEPKNDLEFAKDTQFE